MGEGGKNLPIITERTREIDAAATREIDKVVCRRECTCVCCPTAHRAAAAVAFVV